MRSYSSSTLTGVTKPRSRSDLMVTSSRSSVSETRITNRRCGTKEVELARMRKCTKCGGDGPFYKDPSRSYNQSCWCQACRKQDQGQRLGTPRGRALNTWARIKERVLNANGKQPSYANTELRMTREEFIEWYVQAIQSYEGEYPSLDRINNDGHYEISNLQIIHRSENSRKRSNCYNLNAPEGLAWCSGLCKTYKPLDEFPLNRNRPNGRNSLCKNCASTAKALRKMRRQYAG